MVAPLVLVRISPLVAVQSSRFEPAWVVPLFHVSIRIARVFVAPLSSASRSLRVDHTPPEEVLLALGRLSRAYHQLEFYDELSEKKPQNG